MSNRLFIIVGKRADKPHEVVFLGDENQGAAHDKAWADASMNEDFIDLIDFYVPQPRQEIHPKQDAIGRAESLAAQKSNAESEPPKKRGRPPKPKQEQEQNLPAEPEVIPSQAETDTEFNT
jgi:hypothetical protein